MSSEVMAGSEFLYGLGLLITLTAVFGSYLALKSAKENYEINGWPITIVLTVGMFVAGCWYVVTYRQAYLFDVASEVFILTCSPLLGMLVGSLGTLGYGWLRELIRVHRLNKNWPKFSDE